MTGSAAGARIGAIVPDDGPFDYEWLRLNHWLAATFPGISCIVERSPADGLMLPDRLPAIGRSEMLRPPARRLAQRGADVVVWACMSGSFADGHDCARDQMRELTQAAGVPAISTAVAMAEAALSLAPGKIDLLSTYLDSVTARLVDFLEHYGLELEEIWTLGCVETRESFAIDIVREVEGFCAAVPGDRPILVPDTAINTLELIPRLNEVARRPVITANQASIWYALHLLGRTRANAVASFL